MIILPHEDWVARRADYLSRMRPWAIGYQQRKSRGRKHPVHDFLFEYYWYRPAMLLRWSPGFDVGLARVPPGDIDWQGFVTEGNVTHLPARSFLARRIPSLARVITELELVASREPVFHCLGLHEWAMVYRTGEIRHSQVPLRLDADEVAAVVESQGLRCTHFEAYRFFTPPALPRNRIALTRENTFEHEQPGCIHLNMDLYKYAYNASPFIPSELVAETFELAMAAREIDMKASPYELREYGYEPIRIETREGREEYIEAQRELHLKAIPLRQKLLQFYRDFHAAVLQSQGQP